MRLVRNVCIVLNVINAVVAYIQGDTTNMILALMLIGMFYFINLVEGDHSGK